MASHALPIPIAQARKRPRSQAAEQELSLQTAFFLFLALAILFGWLHVILSLEIASTGRQIQLKSDELEALQRDNNLLRWQVAEAMSPEKLAGRARELGYGPQPPLYLPLTKADSQKPQP